MKNPLKHADKLFWLLLAVTVLILLLKYFAP